MLSPSISFLDSVSEQEVETECGGEEIVGDLDITGTLFATLLTDFKGSNTTDLCSDIMSSNSDAESDDFLDYLSKTQDGVMEEESDTAICDPMIKTSCTNQAGSSGNNVDVNPTKSMYSRPPLMCSTNVNLKCPRVEIKGPDMAAANIKLNTTATTSKHEKCMKRNAIIARENREKKKQYIKQLESNLEEVTFENVDLKTKFTAKSKLCESLQKEVHYLRNVLANQSCIAALLQNIHATPGVAFASSLTTSVNTEDTNSKKRPLDENDNYKNKSKGVYVRTTESHKKIKSRPGESQTDGYRSLLTPCPSPDQVDGTGGVCLHVSNNKVSLELCSQCAEKSSEAWKNSAKIRCRQTYNGKKC